MEPRSGEPFVLDSSVWVALFIDEDSSHAQAAAIIDEIVAHIYVPYIVLSEVATVITNKYSKQQADKFLTFVSGDGRCIPVDNRYATDVQAFLDCREPISFPDISIVTFALQYGLKLITFDRKMRSFFLRCNNRV